MALAECIGKSRFLVKGIINEVAYNLEYIKCLMLHVKLLKTWCYSNILTIFRIIAYQHQNLFACHNPSSLSKDV